MCPSCHRESQGDVCGECVHLTYKEIKTYQQYVLGYKPERIIRRYAAPSHAQVPKFRPPSEDEQIKAMLFGKKYGHTR